MQSDLWSGEIEESERAARFCLWSTSRGMVAAGFESLLMETGGQIQRIWNAAEFNCLKISDALRVRLQSVVDLDYCAQWRAHCERLAEDITLLHRGDRDYPSGFHDLVNPPTFFYVRGDVKKLNVSRKVAIVGSRAANPEMCEFTDLLASNLSNNGVAIISGGALGVDGYAHRGSLAAGGTTLAVLPGALDRPAPGRHRELFEKIAQTGLVISEYPFGASARPFHFARRNRLIAALSDAVIVIRAELASGTMITASAANELERMVCAVPGALEDPFAAGCLDLLVHGAQAIRNADDVMFHVYQRGLEHLEQRDSHGRRLAAKRSHTHRPKAAASASSQVNLPLDLSGLAPDRQQVLAALDELGRTTNHQEILVDELARHLKWNVAQVSSILVELELYQRVLKVVGSHAYRLVGR